MFQNQTSFGSGGLSNLLGVTGLLGFIAFVAIVIVVWRERQGNPLSKFPLPSLVLKRFRVNDRNDANPAVEVVGRASGVISWLFALLRLEPEYQLLVGSADASLQIASLSGLFHTCVPLEKIESTTCGYKRSILALAFSLYCGLSFVLTFVSGLLEANSNSFGTDMGLSFGWLILAGIGALFFFLSKRIAVVFCAGDHCYGFMFKRSVIENVSVDLPTALKAIAVINARVLAAQPATAAAGIHRGASTVSAGSCPQCATVTSPGTRFCENCGLSLA